MKYLLRPLTRKMIEQLKVARAIELNDTTRSISVSDFSRCMGSLYRRGLIDTKRSVIDGEIIHTIYLTKLGLIFLDNYKEL